MRCRKYSLIAIACTLLAALLILSMIFVVRTPRTAVNKFFDEYIQLDSEAILKMVPEEVQLAMQNTAGSEEALIAKMNEQMSASLGALGGYSFKATHVKSIEGEALASIQQYYADNFGRVVKDAKTVEVRLTNHNGAEETYETHDVRVVKIGMRWYLDIGTFAVFTGSL